MKQALFINPYNFIPLTMQKKLADPENRNLTGVIEYSVLTKTPLFVPNTSNDHAFFPELMDHKSYDFFSYKNLMEGEEKKRGYRHIYQKPIIPGSEIRGMFRSNYEILTESCMSVVDDESVLSKRTMERFRAGLIRKIDEERYDLIDAENYRWRVKTDHTERFHEGQCVWFEKSGNKACQVTTEAFDGKIQGYILKGMKGPKKRCCHIFVKKDSKSSKGEVNLEVLECILSKYNHFEQDSYKDYKEQFVKFKKGNVGSLFPVYYSMIENYIMLSPACITREIYEKRLKDILKTFRSCTDKEKLCPACALFGMVNHGTAVSSRIRFTDLLPEEHECAQDYYCEDMVTLPPLLSPNISNIEFYLRKPEGASFWTYDYYINDKGETVPYVPEISGRKFYWHQMDCVLPKRIAPQNLNVTIRPVKAGIAFHGKLYFQNISSKELDQLLWMMNAGESGAIGERKHGYKLGAAKPLGLGSIATSVDRVGIRRIFVDKNQIIREEQEYSWTCSEDLFSPEVVGNFLKMTDFYAVSGKRVSYPVTADQLSDGKFVTDGYKWFVENHGCYLGGGKTDTKSPRKRKEMYYREHLVPMEPELQPTLNKIPVSKVEHKNIN